MRKVVNQPVKRKTQEIREFILECINAFESDLTKAVVEKFDISRQAVAKNIRSLISDGLISADGSARSRKYRLNTLLEHSFSIAITPKTEENQIWAKELAPHFKDIKENVRDLCHHGFTEMMNNVIDHSQSETADIKLTKDAVVIGFSIRDYGIGIWRKLQDKFHLTDSRHAILELAKGNLTTDPDKHTGEGIFFTSRMSDFFTIQAEALTYCCFQDGEEWLFDVKQERSIQGTRVIMEVRLKSGKTPKEVFDKFTSEYDDFGFSRTQLSIQLAKYEGDHLVSRSQAKRILARLQQFKEVWLDFRGITEIGQAFADEIFRVFANEHKEVHLKWVNTTEDVDKMILRAMTTTTEEIDQPELPLT
jgi:DNA-binding MarR family transcriptional regulator